MIGYRAEDGTTVRTVWTVEEQEMGDDGGACRWPC